MALHKGIGIASAREIARRAAMDEDALAERLGPELFTLYRETLPVQWLPVEQSAAVLDEIARSLYPNALSPMNRLARAQADYDLGTIYRVLLRAATVPFVVRRVAMVWSNYNSRGRAHAEELGAASLAIRVVGYPDFPSLMFTNVQGYVARMVEATGARGVRCRMTERGPNLVWEVSWTPR